MILEVLIECLIMVFAAVVMVYGGISIMKHTMTQVTASLGISMGAVYTVVPLSGILIMIYNILNIVDLFRGKEQEHMEVKE